MEFVYLLLATLAGGLIYHILWGGRKSGPIENSIIQNLYKGKRVIISIDDDCYILEMYDNKINMTRGMVSFIEEPEKPPGESWN